DYALKRTLYEKNSLSFYIHIIIFLKEGNKENSVNRLKEKHII
ncbi:hypothetical protein A5802_003355, partial [Enterococcus mundtii]